MKSKKTTTGDQRNSAGFSGPAGGCGGALIYRGECPYIIGGPGGLARRPF